MADSHDILILPGDGIGGEVVSVARQVMEAAAARFDISLRCREGLVGGAAIDATGDPLPEATLDACRDADAVVLGAVGGPRWDDPSAKTRPEAGLLALRKELGLYANLRPIRAQPLLEGASPLRPDLIEGVDILFFRELTGGIYFGPSGVSDDGEEAFSTMVYTADEVRRIVRMAATAARRRRGRLRHMLSLESDRLLLAQDWIDRYRTVWTQSIARLAELAEELERGTT